MMSKVPLWILLSARLVGLSSSFVVPPSKGIVAASPFVYSFVSSKRFSSGVPEAGACPSCDDKNGYWDGGALFVCMACNHEWAVAEGSTTSPTVAATGNTVTKDVNGNELERGDTVLLVKELGKGLKKGLKVKNIRLGDFGDGHDVEASIPGLGTYALKSQFLKKV